MTTYCQRIITVALFFSLYLCPRNPHGMLRLPVWGCEEFFLKPNIKVLMETKIMRVVQQSEAFAVQSQKAENGQTMKCNIMLQEMGGKYENQYVAAILGNVATNKFTPGDIVAATMRFSTREYNGAHYQDILVTDIKCLTPAPSPKGGGE